MSRPFYVIAHQVNELDDIAHSISRGANAIECDISLNDSGAFVVSHPPDLFGSVDLNVYLDMVVTVARNNDHLALVCFDCKPSVADHPDLAVSLLTTIRERLSSQVSLVVLISVAGFPQRGFLGGLAGLLREREGVAIDEHDHPGEVASYFRDVGIERHAYGNGTNALFLEHDIGKSILDAVVLKASDRKGPRFVYVWTLNNRQSIRAYLRMGVDGVFVNFKGALAAGMRSIFEILVEGEFRGMLHLAPRSHDPFAESNEPSYVLEVHTSDLKNAGTDASVSFSLTGADGNLSTTIRTQQRGLFERGDTNSVALLGADIGPLQSLNVARNTAGNAPGWHLDFITVSSRLFRESKNIDFYEWIPTSGLTRPIGRRSYRFEVKTSNKLFAGTDATVHFELVGAVDTLIHDEPGLEGEKFEQDTKTKFTVHGPDLGALRSLTVSLVDPHSTDDWHLAWVKVPYGRPGQVAHFRFNRLIDPGPETAQAQ
jgi:hypothetical protein